MSLQHNPMTAGRIDRLPNGREVLRLRAFAPRRSYRAFDLDRPDNAEEFDAYLAWIEGGEPPAIPRDPMRMGALAFAGILLSDAEAGQLPAHVRPMLGRAESHAAALFPAIRHCLAGEPSGLVKLPAADGGLAAHGYAAIPGIFSEDQLSAVRGWYATLFDGGWTRLDRDRTDYRMVHNEPVGRWILEALTPTIVQMAGESLMPSYALAVQYGGGEELKRHTDRAQCEYSVSLFIDYDPAAPSQPCPWPLVLHSPSGDVPLPQPPGGGPVFRGRSIPHSRAPLAQGHRARMLFLHYVRSGFDGDLE